MVHTHPARHPRDPINGDGEEAAGQDWHSNVLRQKLCYGVRRGGGRDA